jgi:hypothetical protein
VHNRCDDAERPSIVRIGRAPIKVEASPGGRE